MNLPIWSDEPAPVNNPEDLTVLREHKAKNFILSRLTERKNAIIIAVKVALIEDTTRSDLKEIFDTANGGRLTTNPLTDEKPTDRQWAEYNPTFNSS